MFEVLRRDGRARLGRLRTPHGDVETPCFMPVGTRGAVKTILPEELRDMGYRMLLSNAYHLQIRPGSEAVARLGGLHRFMGWDGAILTDSGGYQVFSLAKLRTITTEGVEFLSPVDGKPTFFTPEEVLDIQVRLGSDILMPLDVPVALPADAASTRRALDLTVDWLGRSVRRWDRGAGRALYAIVQGGLWKELRRESVERSMEFDLPGVAIGGLSVGETKLELLDTLDYTASLLPESKPRYAMGIGTPSDLIRAAAMGVDLFDCILPTRFGRTGWAFTSEGLLKMRNRRFAGDGGPLDPACDCRCCRSFSRAYIRHCFNVGEILGLTLLTHHNLRYYARMMETIRRAISTGSMGDLARRADAF